MDNTDEKNEKKGKTKRRLGIRKFCKERHMKRNMKRREEINNDESKKKEEEQSRD